MWRLHGTANGAAAVGAEARKAVCKAAGRRRWALAKARTRVLSSSQAPKPENGLGDAGADRTGKGSPQKSESFQAKDKPVVSASTLAGGVLLASVSAALGSLYLVSQDGKEQIKSRSYLSMPTVELNRRFSTSGSAGAAVTVEAFSVGEQITPEALMLRYAFDESDREVTPPSRPRAGQAVPVEVSRALSGMDMPGFVDEQGAHHGEDEEELAEDHKDDLSAPRKLPLRAKVDRRKQMQVIGKGAYGRVVRALDRATGRPVAMKVVPHTAMSAEALLEEVEVLKRVRGHDNIIHLIEVLYCGGKYYVITELCEGGEILDHLIANGPFTEHAGSTLTNRVASALQHIHKCGYVHLDVKPENLVFATKKSVEDCRIIDFGMARKISEVAGKLSMVRGDKGARVGTMAYWSPEQVQSVVGKDGRNLTDVERTVVRSDPYVFLPLTQQLVLP